MGRWGWVALVVVIASGAATGWYSVQLQRHSMAGLPPHEVSPGMLALSALPSGLLLAASAVRRRSAATQAVVMTVAVVVALGRVIVMQGELTTEWGRTTGLASGLAWLVGTGVAGGVLVTSVVAAVTGRVRPGRYREPSR